MPYPIGPRGLASKDIVKFMEDIPNLPTVPACVRFAHPLVKGVVIETLVGILNFCRTFVTFRYPNSGVPIGRQGVYMPRPPVLWGVM
ncbi:hypothetical protein AVEN_42656-1 [Araneus ventricosus]|uniref:Uncharacterized protein n=1 Tax=Araneus ventricosus TaxID=182803 RepID=A0A4Y2BNE1_ARAVE|nr:hypothetical protein AVEN_42656-1 [Araneus ventricosus]